MRIALILAAISLALAPGGTLAQSVADEPVFAPETVKAHVDFLADDLLEGREAGTRGYEIAARYVATRFEALGLKPAGPNGSWYQSVPLVQYSFDPANPAAVAIAGKSFANGGDVLMGAAAQAGTQTLSGGAVFVGHGLEADYAGLDLQGKFAVALLGIPKSLSGDVAVAASAEDKLATAARHGAIGLISLITPANLGGDFPWDSASEFFTQPQINWLAPDGTPGGAAPKIKIQVYMKGEAAKALFAGAPMGAEQLFASLAAAAKSPPKGFALARSVSITRTSLVKDMASPNVVAMLPGSDPTLAGETVVLSAHLDHLGTNPKRAEADKTYNGAMDNASGVATMLEVARGFAEGRRPKRSILFVALTGEEEGLLGSDYLARYPLAGSGKLVADVNLDMPILLYDFTDVVAFGAEHSTMGPIVERAGARMGVKLSPDPLPEENLFVRSDHYSFVKAGVPSVFLVTGFANGGEKAFRDFLANNYHKASDQPDLPFNWAAGAKFARLNYLIAREIADGAEPPRWYEGNEYGDRFAPGQPRAKKPAAKP